MKSKVIKTTQVGLKKNLKYPVLVKSTDNYFFFTDHVTGTVVNKINKQGLQLGHKIILPITNPLETNDSYSICGKDVEIVISN